MFGHHEDNENHDGNAGGAPQPDVTEPDTDATPASAESENAALPAAAHDSDDSDAPAPDNKPAADVADSAQPAASDDDKDNDDKAWQHPGEPIDDEPEQISDITPPPGGQPQQPPTPMPINARDLPDDDTKTPHELIDIKQKALNELQPLLSQLDQSPEDKFRTLLMIIQASDNQDMIKDAYAAADDIKDEKARAQALLDLVNEINYFTQHPTS